MYINMKYKNNIRKYISLYFAFFIVCICFVQKSQCKDTLEMLELRNEINQTGVGENIAIINENDNKDKDNSSIINAESETIQNSGDNTVGIINSENVDKNEDNTIDDNAEINNEIKLSDREEASIHKDNHHNQSGDNNLDKEDEDLFRDEGVIEEANEELIKEAESIEKSSDSTSQDSEWERVISDFEPAEMLTIELDQKKEVRIK
jgi:hypothetical protein